MNNKLLKTFPPALEFDWEILNNKTLFIKVESSVELGWETTVVMGVDAQNNYYVIATRSRAVEEADHEI